jgi:hypothetical protein
MESEHKNKCDCCGKVGGGTFARIFYKKINGIWKYLCKECWDKQPV